MTRYLTVISYDISRNSDRQKIARLLEGRLARVQKSVFEGRLSPAESKALAEECELFLGEDDSLRVYVITRVGHRFSFTKGATALAEPGGSYIL